MVFADGGATIQKISIPILKDNLYEPTPAPETFTVTITGATVSAANSTHVVSIFSHDPKPLSRISFSLPAASEFDENLGKTQSAVINVTRTAPIDIAASVEYYTVAGLATGKPGGVGLDTDYFETNGILNFAAGSTTSTPSNISITIFNDAIPEASGNVVISVTRSGGTAGGLVVNFRTTPGSANSPTEYGAVNKSITFTAGGALKQTISIPIVNDNAIDSIPLNKDFIVTLSGTAVGPNNTKTVTIIDAGVPRLLTTAELVGIWSLLL